MKTFKKTGKQLEVVEAVKRVLYLLLEGGSRSGKTLIIVYIIFVRAIKYAHTDHLSVRSVFNDAKKALWLKTIPDVHRICFPNLQLRYDKTDFYVEFPNGSRYWIGGLDDAKRREKVLGNEYATIHENEITQISYKSHTILKTRLNPPPDVKPLMLLDQNPGSKRHWGFKLFHLGVDPIDDKPIDYADSLGVIKMNPADNLDNLNPVYVNQVLGTMTGDDKERFVKGNYTEITGAIYNKFNESMVITDDKPCDYYVVGIDLITYAAVLIGFMANDVIILDERGGKDLTASELNKIIVDDWKKYQYSAYIDWNLSETGTREFDSSNLAIKGAGSVEAGINQIKQLMESRHFWIHERCYRTRLEIEDYHRDDNGKIVKGNDHYIDGMRYGIYSHTYHGEPTVRIIDL